MNWPLSLDRDPIKEFISESICGLIWIYNACGVKDERAWDLFYDIIFYDPVTTRHFWKFQLMWQHGRSTTSSFPEWWAALGSYMGQMFDKTRNHMNNWRWDNPRIFGDQIDRFNPQTTSSGKVDCTSEHYPWYGSDDLKAKIEPPCCRHYKPDDFLAVRPLNWDEIIEVDDDDENCADSRTPRNGTSRPSDGNDNDDSEGEEDTHGGEKETGKVKGTKDRKGNRKGKATEEGKGKWNRNGNRKGIVEQTLAGDVISRAVAVQLEKEMYEADSDTEG